MLLRKANHQTLPLVQEIAELVNLQAVAEKIAAEFQVGQYEM